MKANIPRITPEEIALIKSAQAGNMLAFNKLYYKYSGFTTNLLYHYLKDMDESRDINNLVWDKVYRKLSKFDDYSSFGGWLRILTNRTAIDYLRKLKPSICVPEPLDVRQDYSIDNEETSADSSSYNQVLEVIKRFPEDIRRIFELYYVEHLTVAEISDVTKIPTGTIKSHLSRKRKLIKKLLDV
jgi:RNA polymerase sigma-70 factor (ECF subfamily)